MKRFTTKRAEYKANVRVRLVEASVGRKAVCGFTLIESLVAITIVTLAISGTMVTASSAVIAADISRDQLTASYLAQEGIEYVRWMRDNYYLSAYYNSPTHNTTNAFADFILAIPAECSGVAGCDLAVLPNFESKASFPNFTRTIQVTPASSVQPNTEEIIVSKVSWISHGTTYSVTIIDHLTPWQ